MISVLVVLSAATRPRATQPCREFACGTLLNRRDEIGGAGVVDRDQLRLQRLRRLAVQDVGVAIDGDDSGDRIFRSGETLALENRAQRDIPRLVLHFGGNGAGYILADDDGASGECGERSDDVTNVGVLERDGNRRLL
jgi:hypothetical protein